MGNSRRESLDATRKLTLAALRKLNWKSEDCRMMFPPVQLKEVWKIDRGSSLPSLIAVDGWVLELDGYEMCTKKEFPSASALC